MKLHIKDKLFMPQILPAQNTFLEFNLKKSILEKVAITAKEREDFKIVSNKEEGTITWDSEKDMAEPIVVDFSKEEMAYLKKGCEALSSAPYPDDFWVTVEKIYNEAE